MVIEKDKEGREWNAFVRTPWHSENRNIEYRLIDLQVGRMRDRLAVHGQVRVATILSPLFDQSSRRCDFDRSEPLRFKNSFLGLCPFILKRRSPPSPVRRSSTIAYCSHSSAKPLTISFLVRFIQKRLNPNSNSLFNPTTAKMPFIANEHDITAINTIRTLALE